MDTRVYVCVCGDPPSMISHVCLCGSPTRDALPIKPGMGEAVEVLGGHEDAEESKQGASPSKPICSWDPWTSSTLAAIADRGWKVCQSARRQWQTRMTWSLGEETNSTEKLVSLHLYVSSSFQEKRGEQHLAITIPLHCFFVWRSNKKWDGGYGMLLFPTKSKKKKVFALFSLSLSMQESLQKSGRGGKSEKFSPITIRWRWEPRFSWSGFPPLSPSHRVETDKSVGCISPQLDSCVGRVMTSFLMKICGC